MILRAPLLACSILAAGAAWADRVATIPTGTKLRTGLARFEARAEAGSPFRTYLEAGIGPSWEMGVRSVGDQLGLKLSYNYLFPITDISPGLSIGVDDLANGTPEGRGAYMAFTFHLGNSGELNQDIPTEFTLGAWTRREGGLFLGAVLPVARPFRFLFEHDSRRLTAGFEVRPVRDAGVKVLFTEGAPSLSLSYQARF